MAEALDPEDYETLEETKIMIDNIVELFQNTLSQLDLERLTSRGEAWKAFIEEAKLSREKEEALHCALKKNIAHMTVDNEDTLQGETQRMNSLKAIPELERKLAEHIVKLNNLADHIDEEHKDFAISHVVTDSTSAASGILGLLGLVLAPFTPVGSLALSAAGLGLGAAAIAAGFISLVAKETRTKMNEGEARRLVSVAIATQKNVSMSRIEDFRKTKDISKALKELGQQVHVFRMARIIMNRRLTAQHDEGTPVSMTRGPRVRGAVFGALFLGMDAYSIVTGSVHLYEGAKVVLAKSLRQVAEELKKNLEEHDEFHDSALRPVSVTSSSSFAGVRAGDLYRGGDSRGISLEEERE